MHRNTLHCFSLIVALIFSAAHTAFAAPPNVVVILTDDQGWGDVTLNGNPNLATPHIDSLARDGAMFEWFFVQPVCSPTRAEFLTGRYHVRGGVHSTSTGGERLDLDEHTIAQTFKAAGYATGAFGKWHNGTQHPYHPNARGFDEYYGFTSGHWGHYFAPMLDHNGRLTTGKGFVIDDFTDRAMQFIEQSKDKPFLVYLPLNTPHTPAQVPDEYYAKFADMKLQNSTGKDDAKTRATYAMCENIDWNIGRVLKKLDELKLAENTIVVYFHDNGPNGPRWNGGMRGTKGSTDDGGVRSPLHVRWPAKIKPGTKVKPIAGAIDLLPTLADLAAVKVLSEKPLDGCSLKPLLLGDGVAMWPPRTIFNCWSGRVSARTDQYRLDNTGKLYDIQADPGQTRDIAKDQPAVAEKLAAEVAAWRKDVLSELVKKDDRPFPIGHGPFPVTQLPARDGVPHGNVKRSAGAPNCSFFKDWKTPEDRITWAVDVGTAGKYEAVVYYTCPAADVGSEIELGLNGAKATAKVTEAHDPPLYGMEKDRVDRGSESFVKDFKPMKLGTLDLKPGRGELTLRALSVPGKSVMDVRLIVLTRVAE